MRHSALRLSPRHRRWFYTLTAVLFLSGVAWLALHLWTTRGSGDVEPSPAEPWLLRIHGAAAMAVLVLLGTLIPLHVRRGWIAHLNRSTGLTMIVGAAVLIVTGYGLYYAGSEDLRVKVELVHDVVGVGVPLLLWWHIRSGRRAK